MRWLVLLVAVVAIASVDWAIIRRHDAPPPGTPTASHLLPAGTLLEPDDLRPPPPAVGRYTRVEVKEGRPITDLTDTPTVHAPASGNLIVGLPLQRRWVTRGSINADKPAVICSGSNVLWSGRVQSVVCPENGDDCTAFVEAPTAIVAKVASPTSASITLHPSYPAASGATPPRAANLCW